MSTVRTFEFDLTLLVGEVPKTVQARVTYSRGQAFPATVERGSGVVLQQAEEASADILGLEVLVTANGQGCWRKAYELLALVSEEQLDEINRLIQEG